MAANYPVGIQSFPKLMKNDAIYVDKTQYLFPLIASSLRPYYFLSRPRRFGKSLLISTLKAIFEGKKELFKGLYIENKIEWKSYPVIHLSMDRMDLADVGLRASLEIELKSIAKTHEVSLTKQGLNAQFRELIEELYKKYDQQVVILVDEYDKPITHGLEKGNTILAEENRDIMKNLYSGLKSMDDYIRFLFITGISKFAKVSIFSDLNHLTDITLEEQYAGICGYTQTELEHYFQEGIELLAEKYKLSKIECLDKLKYWYNGFSWDAKTFVYNPFSTLRLFASRQFHNYWFETGTPTFLVKMLNEEMVYDMSNEKARLVDFDVADLSDLDAKSILLQTGYLTLKKQLNEEVFEVDYPNNEVKQSFSEMLLGQYLRKRSNRTGIELFDLQMAFLENDLEKVMKIIETMFHSVPVELFSKKDKKGKTKEVGENFYHAVIYLIFNLLGIKMQAEVMVKEGRIDAVVETKNHIYLFEFKKEESPETALAQIETRAYMQQYALSPKTIHLIGVRFSLEKRGINQDDWESKVWEK